jgi:hypothetical protein
MWLYLLTGSIVTSFADDDNNNNGIAQTQVEIDIASLDINGIKALSTETLSLLTYTQCIQLTDRLVKFDELDDEVKLKLFLNLDQEKFKTIFVEQFDKNYKSKDYKKFEKELKKELKEFYKVFLPKGIKAKIKVKKGQVRIKFEVEKKYYKYLHTGVIQWLDFENFKAKEILALLADLSEVELRQLSYYEWVWLILHYLDEKIALQCSQCNQCGGDDDDDNDDSDNDEDDGDDNEGDNDDNRDDGDDDEKSSKEKCSNHLIKIEPFFPRGWTIKGNQIQLTLEAFLTLAENIELLELLGKKIAWFDASVVGYFSEQQREEINFVGLPKIYFAMLPDEARFKLSSEAKAAFILSIDDLERISVQDLPEGWEYVVINGKNKLKLTQKAVEQLSLEFIAALTTQHFALFDASIMKYLTAEQFIQINSEVLVGLEIEYLEQIAESVIAELPVENATKYFVSLNFKQFEQKFHKQYGKDYIKKLEKFYRKLVPAGWKVKKKAKHGKSICQFKPPKEALQWVPQKFVPFLNFEIDEGESTDDIVQLVEGLSEEQLIELSSEQLEYMPEIVFTTIKNRAPLVSLQIFLNLDITQITPTILAAFTPNQEEIENLPLDNLADEQLTTLVQRIEPGTVTTITNKLSPPKLVQVLLNLEPDQFETKNMRAPTGWIIEPNTIDLTPEAASESNLTVDIIPTFTGEQIKKFKPKVFQYLTANQVSHLSPSAVSGLTAPMIANLDLTAISGLTAPQMNALSPEAMLGLDSTKIAHLNVHAVNGLTAPQLAFISIEAMGGWQPETFAALSPPALEGFITAQVLYMLRANPDIRNAITVEQWEFMPITLENPTISISEENNLLCDILKLSTAKLISKMPPETFQKFTKKIFKCIPSEALQGLTAMQLNNIPPKAFQGLIAEQLDNIPPETFKSLTAAQLNQIPPTAFFKSLLSIDIDASLEPRKVNSINDTIDPEVIKDIADLGEVVNLEPLLKLYYGLTAAQLNNIPPKTFTGLTSAQLNNIPPETFTGLTATQIDNIPAETFEGLTAKQVNYILPSAFSQLKFFEIELKPSEIDRSFIKTEIKQVLETNPTLFDNLTTTQVVQSAEMLPTHFGDLTTDQPVQPAITEEQLLVLACSLYYGLKSDQVAHIPATTFSGFKQEQIPHILPCAFEGLTKGQIIHLVPETFGDLSAAQVAKTPAEVFESLTTDQCINTSKNAFNGLMQEQINNVPSNVFLDCRDARLSELVAKQIALILPSMIKDLTVEHITLIPPEAFGSLTADQAAAFQPTVIAGLTAKQFSFIPPTAFEKITAEQVAALQPETLKTLTAEQFANLPPQAFRGLTAEIIIGPLAPALTNLRAEQIAEIPPEAITGLTIELIKSIPIDALKGFTNKQLGYLDNQTKTTFLTQRLSSIPNVAVLDTKADGQVVLEVFSEQPEQQIIVGLFEPVVAIDSECETGITFSGEVGFDHQAIFCYGDGTKQTMMPVVQDYAALQQATDTLLAAMDINERIAFQFHEDGTASFIDLSGTKQWIVPEFELTLETTTEPEAEPVIHILNDEITLVELIVNAQSQVLHLSPSQSDDRELNKAQVNEIEILILESFPVQVQVLVKGNFINGCERIKAINTEKSDNTFIITITTHFIGEICTEALVPFEETIPLEVEGLPAGIYTVDAHGLTATFELITDNVVPTTPSS